MSRENRKKTSKTLFFFVFRSLGSALAVPAFAIFQAVAFDGSVRKCALFLHFVLIWIVAPFVVVVFVVHVG